MLAHKYNEYLAREAEKTFGQMQEELRRGRVVITRWPTKDGGTFRIGVLRRSDCTGLERQASLTVQDIERIKYEYVNNLELDKGDKNRLC